MFLSNYDIKLLRSQNKFININNLKANTLKLEVLIALTNYVAAICWKQFTISEMYERQKESIKTIKTIEKETLNVK